MKLTVKFDREDDGRFIAEIPQLNGLAVYGATRPAAAQEVKLAALQLIMDRIDAGTATPLELEAIDEMFDEGSER